MSNMDKSKFFYNCVEVDGNYEIDFLDGNLHHIDLPTVTTFRVRQPFTYRPDLISYKFMGSYNYGWLIALHNDFLDPVFDFEDGVLVNIPDMDAYFKFFSENKIPRSKR